jgi:hypothetical protein
MHRRILATGAAVVALAGAAAYVSHATDGPPDPGTSLGCQRDPIVAGGWYCQVPTPGRMARVYITAWEDGSARAVALDPDAEITMEYMR